MRMDASFSSPFILICLCSLLLVAEFPSCLFFSFFMSFCFLIIAWWWWRRWCFRPSGLPCDLLARHTSTLEASVEFLDVATEKIRDCDGDWRDLVPQCDLLKELEMEALQDPTLKAAFFATNDNVLLVWMVDTCDRVRSTGKSLKATCFNKTNLARLVALFNGLLDGCAPLTFYHGMLIETVSDFVICSRERICPFENESSSRICSTPRPTTSTGCYSSSSSCASSAASPASWPTQRPPAVASA